MDQVLKQKEKTLRSKLERLGHIAVAFSAGVDSTFLLQAAYDVLGDHVIAVTGRTISSPQREIQEASAFCNSVGVRHLIIDVDQMAIPGFEDNPPDRCYHCKKALFSAFLATAQANGFSILVEGTNADDLQDYRPGLRALQELKIRSPLKEAGLTKQDIRILSRELGLSTWDKPSLACLATRIPYGESITPQKLTVIDNAEQFLRENGFRQVRVRLHGSLARIEIEPSQFEKILELQMSQQIKQHFSELGFDYVTLDLAGYRSGSMNKTI